MVEVSPSTVIRLKLWGRAWRKSVFRTRGVAAASVKINTRSVAISGWIMPEPLAMPARVNSWPSIMPLTREALGRVSVVMMARAASPNPSGFSPATNGGRAWIMRSPGSGAPMTPVDDGSTRRSGILSNLAAARQVARAASNPRGPLQALALPAFTRMAWAVPPRRRAWVTTTGAAFTRLLGEDPGRGRGGIRHHQGQVQNPGLFDGRGGGGEFKSRDDHGNKVPPPIMAVYAASSRLNEILRYAQHDKKKEPRQDACATNFYLERATRRVAPTYAGWRWGLGGVIIKGQGRLMKNPWPSPQNITSRSTSYISCRCRRGRGRCGPPFSSGALWAGRRRRRRG